MKKLFFSTAVLCLAGSSQAKGQDVITTVAGIGPSCTSILGCGAFSGDSGPATSAALNYPFSVTVDASGNLFIADTYNNRIRKVSATSGIITTVAGIGPSCASGCAGFAGDGGPATSAQLNEPLSVAVDASGNVFIGDTNNHRVRKVSAASGIITTVAGNGTFGFSGDGGAGTSAELTSPVGLSVDASGNLYIADVYNNRIRKVSAATGIITTAAGSGAFGPSGGASTGGFSGDSGPATSAVLNEPTSTAVDASGNLFIVDALNYRIRKVSAASGVITTVAGNGTSGFSGDGGQATSAELASGRVFGSVALDASGNLFIGDTGNARIREVSAVTGIITTVAGNGTAGFSGDGGPASSAELYGPEGVAVAASGNLFFTDPDNNRIREVSAPVTAPLTITPNGVVPIYSAVTTIQAGEWVSIYGAGLATSTATYSGSLPYPTSLGGTSVTIDGKSALLYYVSPTLIDLIAPADAATGSILVAATTSQGTGTSPVTLAQFAPSFFLLDSKHVAGIILRTDGSGAYGGGTYDIIGPTGNSLGYATVAAKAGDVVELFANGLGPTNPAAVAGQGSSVVAPTTNPVTVVVNNGPVTPSYAGLSSEAGIYQINLTVPAGLGTGDVPLVASVGGVHTPFNIVISLQ